MDDQQIVIGAGLCVTALAVLASLLVMLVFRSRRAVPRPSAKCDLMRWIIPDPEDLIVPRLPEGWQAVFPHAGEVFFPRAPYSGAVYQIELEGECLYHPRRDETERADALYRAPRGRFVDRHRELRINNKDLPNWTTRYELATYKKFFEIAETDRGNHVYKINLDDLGEPISIAFGDAREGLVHVRNGYLRVRVTPLPEGTPSIARRQEQERKREKARQEAADAAEEMARAVKKLSIRSLTYRNWEDPAFCAKFAQVHCEDVIKNQAEIRKEATAFLEQHELVQHLRMHNPSAARTILGRLETLLIAERIALDRATAAAEAEAAKPAVEKAIPAPAPAKKKLTTADVQQLKVRRQQIEIGDKVALAKDRIATKQEIKAYVKAQYPDLDDDERQAMFQEILGQVDEEEQHGTTL
jgi:hypothetical protein